MADVEKQDNARAAGPVLVLLHILFITTVYLIFAWPILGDPSVLPFWDNIKYHLPRFAYIANSLKLGFGFPLWTPDLGGVPIGITSVSMFPFTPHRVVGYALFAMLSTDAVTVYKVGLVAGLMTSVICWWFVLRRLCGSMSGASFGCLMVLLGGTGITTFHQEQMLATIAWAPFVMLALMRLKDDLRALPFLAVFLGFAMTVHYPQIEYLTFLFVLIALAVTRKIKPAFVRDALRRWPIVVVSLVLFVLAASPAVYIKATKDDFSSPVRQSEKIGMDTLEDYLVVNRQQISSAPFGYLGNYFWPGRDVFIDQYTFYATYAGLFFVFAGIALRFRASVPILIVTALCMWAVLGINGYMAQMLFVAKFPFIDYFRQWYHFAPMVNFCLSALGALGFTALVSRLGGLNAGRGLSKGIIAAVIAIGAMALQSAMLLDAYIERYQGHWQVDSLRLSEGEFLAMMRGNDILRNMAGRLHILPGEPLVTYTAWYRLDQSCMGHGNRTPFIGNSVVSDFGIPEDDRRELAREFCEEGYSSTNVLATVPPTDVEDMGPLVPTITFGRDDGRVDLKTGRNLFLPREYYSITPRGIWLKGSVDFPAFMVVPYGHMLGLKAYLNGEAVRTYPVYNGGMTGVFLPSGEFELKLEVPFSGYQLSLLLQAALLMGVIGFAALSAIRGRRRKAGGKGP